MEGIRIYTGGRIHVVKKAQLRRWRRKHGQRFYYIREMGIYVPVTENFCREFLREEWSLQKQEQRRREFACPQAELWDWLAEREPDTAVDPAELLLRQEYRQELHRAVGSLAKAERELLAFCLAGKSEREIAAYCGFSKTTIHKRKLRLRKALDIG